MADSQPSHSAGSQSQNRGGRRRGRGGGSNQAGQAETRQRPDDGSGRGSRNRGRGGRGGGGGGRDKQNRNANANTVSGNAGQPPSGTPAGGVGKAKQAAEEATDDADDGEVCFICASTVEHTSVSPCNHRTCHICALRIRALYKNKACAHCRVSYGLDLGNFMVAWAK